MYSHKNERAFLEAIYELPYGDKKLILAERIGNHIQARGEIRCMATAGGYQYGIAAINFVNQREGGIYTIDAEEAYIHAMDISKTCGYALEWIFSIDCGHTFYTSYDEP